MVSRFQLWMLCELKIQFERHMNEGKYHLAEPLVAAICALNRTEGLFRYAGSEPGSEQVLNTWRS